MNNFVSQLLVFFILLLPCFTLSCKSQTERPAVAAPIIDTIKRDGTQIQKEVIPVKITPKLKDTLANGRLINLLPLDSTFVLDIRYATDKNLTGIVLYDCPACYLAPEAATALAKANKLFIKKGYRIKLYDCYRPHSVQKKMWAKIPDARYIANPAKGSMHNRGLAVDLTLVDSLGNELDMGTDFDYFGKEAYPYYSGHSNKIKENRKLLQTVLATAGFRVTKSEWWHFYYTQGKSYKLLDVPFGCE